MAFEHETVLLKEATDGLAIRPDGIYVDCTLGGAGHSSLILEQLSDKGHLYAFDQDSTAIEHAKSQLKSAVDEGKVTFVQSNFRYIKEALQELNIDKVDGVLYDLGVSSPQLDEAERGFSYHQDAAYDDWIIPQTMVTCWMTLDNTSKETGTLEYLKGSHKWGLQPPKGEFHSPDDYKKEINRLNVQYYEFNINPYLQN